MYNRVKIPFSLPVSYPYDWEYLYLFLQNHRAEGMERFKNGRYFRNFRIGDHFGAFEIEWDPKIHSLHGMLWLNHPGIKDQVIHRIQRVFDTEHIPPSFLPPRMLESPLLEILMEERGIRIPGAFSPFETAISIILGQLVSVEQARVKVERLVLKYGEPFPDPIYPECGFLFPRPESLMEAGLETLGITQIRRKALRELSRRVFTRELNLDLIPSLPESRKLLKSIPGIGDWTVEMMALRCFGDPSAFPKSDLILKRALELYSIKKIDWNEYNAYMALSLWKRFAVSLSKKAPHQGI